MHEEQLFLRKGKSHNMSEQLIAMLTLHCIQLTNVRFLLCKLIFVSLVHNQPLCACVPVGVTRAFHMSLSWAKGIQFTPTFNSHIAMCTTCNTKHHSQCVLTVSGAHQTSHPKGARDSSPEVKQLITLTTHLHLEPEVRKEWIYTSTRRQRLVWCAVSSVLYLLL
jgi:hypothetical protein